MQNIGDNKRQGAEDDGMRFDPDGYLRAERCSRALVGTIVGVSMLALALAAGDISRADFPLMGLLVFVIGLAFGGIPLLLYHEYLLKDHAAHVARARLIS
ncbi:hypothetical protein QTH91_03140 [Variovorax dokdonensis]|uniref:Uncharacterized protein n=1 Tax=Variovorax dokdonensis TaxID=344883 RepID=A0ABT7N6E5_9BURK|nr:hypothetical protein [Variovorax dokdonensis]MDM0043465.1 hypothetical protein [Variovorax dokdonensis]